MRLSPLFQTVRYIAVVSVMLLIWLIIGMVYWEKFVTPFAFLMPWLMPWKGLTSIPVDASLTQRLRIMQGLLDASVRVADYALFTMIISFGIFSFYLTFVYQQKKRKTQENRLLQMKNQEIARRNEFIRYISATIGHEFKNNLGRIKRRIDLSADIPAETSVRIRDTFDKLFADIDIFKKISDEREAGLIDFRSVNLRGILAQLGQQYGDLADVSFNEKMNLSPPSIYASETLLKTVFENLFDNAIKYKKPEQDRAKIRLSCGMDFDSTRRYVTLSFRDEGIGMDEKQADRCFYKGKGTGEGWGQGLYFVKYVVGLHAGKIRIGKEYTRPGIGTEVIINLPFVEESIYV